ncbi:MAG: DUF4384 domain-containing protein [Bacteroidota bacterium]|nr:DUF4384 domain-containing protein [Bacteroidota bacterium]
MVRKLLILVLAVLPIRLIAANKIDAVSGEATYYAPSTVSLEDAKRTAVDRARIAALADKYGTILSQNNLTVISNKNGQSGSDFTSLGASEVKGEWLEDVEPPAIKVSYEKDMLAVYAKVTGKAREITRAAITIDAKILSNGRGNEFETNRFNEGDDLFLAFQSPVDGYLAVYLLDDTQTSAYCLLPYAKNKNGYVQIRHGQRYVFFDQKSADPSEQQEVDELELTADKSVEHNWIYLVFSPNNFTKANDNLVNESLPRSLTVTDFQRWLIKNQNIDKEMQVAIKPIEIRKKTD